MDPHPDRYVPRSRTAALLVVAVVLTTLLVGTGVAVWAGRPGAPRVPRTADRALLAPRLEVRAAAVLTAWDRRRAGAWASGRSADLGGLYVVGSPAGRHDLAMLGRWHARGLRVEGLRTQVLALRVLEHRSGFFAVEVVDRVVAGAAVGESGVRRRLPRDAPSTRRVVLVDGPRGWQVASVSARGPAPPPPPR